ncbi:MAG: hypothetical protein ABGY42_05705 [bacterium]
MRNLPRVCDISRTVELVSPSPIMRETKNTSQLRLSDLMVLVALIGTLIGGLLTL